MTKKELFSIADKVRRAETFEANVNRFLETAKKDLQFIEDQDERNSIVNKIAQLLREEYGVLNEEVAETLNQLRLVKEENVVKEQPRRGGKFASKKSN